MDDGDGGLVELELPARAEHLHLVGALIAALLEPLEDLPERARLLDAIQLAAHEVCANMVRHAYAGRADGRIAVGLRLGRAPRRVLVELRDTGLPFDPRQVPAPDPHALPTGGFGLLLVRRLADEVSYSAGPDGNCWRLVKYL